MSVDPENRNAPSDKANTPRPLLTLEQQAVVDSLQVRQQAVGNALPFAKRFPIIAGALIGVLMRFAVELNLPGGAMGMAFVFGAPILVGAFTVYLAERVRPRTIAYYLRAGSCAVALFVFGTLLILIEGLICAILIVPLFAVLGAFGGLLMGLICRYTLRPKKGLFALSCLPVFLALIENSVSLQHVQDHVTRSVDIHATPAQIWSHLLHAPAIGADEVPPNWITRIGVPVVHSGEFDALGATRRVRMDKKVYFDEKITEFNENQVLAWRYQFYPDSFPPNALDEHVVVGGEFFDLGQTRYRLEAQGEITRLHIDFSYRVSTRFNWYAAPLARWLLGDLSEANLMFYQRRAEASARASNAESARPITPSPHSNPK